MHLDMLHYCYVEVIRILCNDNTVKRAAIHKSQTPAQDSSAKQKPQLLSSSIVSL